MPVNDSPAAQSVKPGNRLVGSFLLLGAMAWVALMPWRPMLAGDDFGYFESVVLTVCESRVMLSDWLNPFSVGLTVPAAVVTTLVGDIWLGCMLTLGVFGMLGAGAVHALLRELGLSKVAASIAMLTWVLLPVWLGKWTRFEGPVPAASLMIVAIWSLLRGCRPKGARLGADWFWLLAGASATAWAISIRQNHIIMVGFGVILILFSPNLDRRGCRLMLWAVLPLMVFALLQGGLSKTFAMQHMLDWRLSQLSLLGYMANLLRGLGFSTGCAGLLLVLTHPSAARSCLKRVSGGRAWLGVATCVGILGGVATGGGLAWISPATDILLLEKCWPVTALLTLAGALAWPGLLATTQWRSAVSLNSVFFLTAVGYLLLTSIWGYWEYYFIESSLLLWCAGLSGRQSGETQSTPWRWFSLQTLLPLGLVATSWLSQRISTDQQTERLQIFEQAFRKGLVVPFNCSGMPLGLAGWNLFPAYAEKWKTTKEGNPLSFWNNRAPDTYFRWRDATVGRVSTSDVALTEGVAEIGFFPMPWTLYRRTAKSPVPGHQLPVPAHRPLPLSRAEWEQYLINNSR